MINMQLTNWSVMLKKCSWFCSLSAVTDKVIRSVINETVSDLFICLTLRISRRPSIDCNQWCEEMHSQLRCDEFKHDMLKWFDLLSRGECDIDVFSVLCCFNSTLFIVEVYEIILHGWQWWELNHLWEQDCLKSRAYLVSDVVHALILSVSEKDWQAVKLNKEVWKPLFFLN